MNFGMDFRPIRDRANVVCIECHSRKVKCDLQESTDETCRHCRRTNTKCVRRDGVRKKRKLANPPPQQVPPRFSPTGAFGGTIEVPSMISPAQSGGSATTPGRRQDGVGSFMADNCLMSFDPASERAMQGGHAPRIVSARDAILRLTEAEVLPPPALLQALKESFLEHVLPLYPVLDPSDLSSPSPSILLLQAVCLAGCLMRHDQKSLELGYAQYEKIRTLLHVEYEKDDLVVLKTLCLMSCWSAASPYVVTFDGPWHWVGLAVRMALQMGLQKQTTYVNNDRTGTLRRIFWHLRNSEWLMAICWGRPCALRVEDCDIPVLTEDDFPKRGLPTTVSVQMSKLVNTAGRIAELSSKKTAPPEQNITELISSLCSWQQVLPDEMRLYDSGGRQRPFHRHTWELHIHYLTTIILVQMLFKDHMNHWRTSGPSIVAACCVARLYNDINCREQAAHLFHFHAFLCLVSAVVLVTYRPQSEEKKALRKKDLETLFCTLEVMGTKFGGARVLLDKIRRIQFDIESGRSCSGQSPHLQGEMSSLPGTSSILGNRVGDLFPFPRDFCENMSMLELGQEQGNVHTGDGFSAVDMDLFGQPDAMFSIMDILGMNFETFEALDM